VKEEEVHVIHLSILYDLWTSACQVFESATDMQSLLRLPYVARFMKNLAGKKCMLSPEKIGYPMHAEPIAQPLRSCIAEV
jgi:hypothetical protein